MYFIFVIFRWPSSHSIPNCGYDWESFISPPFFLLLLHTEEHTHTHSVLSCFCYAYTHESTNPHRLILMAILCVFFAGLKNDLTFCHFAQMCHVSNLLSYFVFWPGRPFSLNGVHHNFYFIIFFLFSCIRISQY